MIIFDEHTIRQAQSMITPPLSISLANKNT
jgi:hypothetical protein